MTEGRKKVIVVGATGMIGSAVVNLIQAKYDVIRAARSGGDIRVDATSAASVAAMFSQVGAYDALIAICGSGAGGSFMDVSDDAILEGFRSKTLAQIRLVQMGLSTMRDGGSITLTSGILSREPFPGFSAIATVNGALDAFCLGASVEMPRGIRINCVTPVFMSETLAKAGIANTAYPELSIAETAKGYLWSLEGDFTGEIIDAREPPPNRGAVGDEIASLIDKPGISY